MSEGVIIRHARMSDLECLLEMEQKVISAERPFNDNIKDSGVKYYDIEHLISDADSCLLVAELESRIVACGYAQIRQSKLSYDHDRHAYLGFMYVEPEVRGRRVIQQIIEELLDWSKSQGVEYSYLDVYAGNAAAITAYKKMGFEASMTEMKLCLK